MNTIYKKYRKNTAEKYYVGHLRKIAIWYSKGLPYSKRAREAISYSKSFDEIIEVLDKLKSNYDIKWLKRWVHCPCYRQAGKPLMIASALRVRNDST